MNLDDVQSIVDPMSKVEAGLKAGGKPVPLEAVHVRAKLIDLAAQVKSIFSRSEQKFLFKSLRQFLLQSFDSQLYGM